MHTIRVAILSGLCMVALGACTSDSSGEAPEISAPASMAEVGEAEPGAAATPESRAFIDPVTGEMRAPTEAELAAMQPAESTDPAVKQQAPAPVKTVLPDGTIMYDMRNQPQVEERVCVQADGSIGSCPSK